MHWPAGVVAVHAPLHFKPTQAAIRPENAVLDTVVAAWAGQRRGDGALDRRAIGWVNAVKIG